MTDPALLLDANVGWLTVLFLGLSVGFTTCTAVCLPYLGSWSLSRGQGGYAATMDTYLFCLGKLLAYASLGGLAGGLGDLLIQFVNGGVGHYMIGSASIMAGLLLLWRQKPHKPCMIARQGKHLSPLMMGYALSFTPCPPLAALLAFSASSGSLWAGAGYGTLFGIGAAFTPLFLVMPLIGMLGKKLNDQRGWMERWLLWCGGLVLIIIGLKRILLA